MKFAPLKLIGERDRDFTTETLGLCERRDAEEADKLLVRHLISHVLVLGSPGWFAKGESTVRLHPHPYLLV